MPAALITLFRRFRIEQQQVRSPAEFRCLLYIIIGRDRHGFDDFQVGLRSDLSRPAQPFIAMELNVRKTSKQDLVDQTIVGIDRNGESVRYDILDQRICGLNG